MKSAVSEIHLPINLKNTGDSLDSKCLTRTYKRQDIPLELGIII